MNKTFSGRIVVDGYGSGETDFNTRLAQSAPEVQQAVDTEIIQPIVAALNTSDQTVSLTILGHADRDDTPGLSREDHRITELSASAERMESALEAINDSIGAGLGEATVVPIGQRQQLTATTVRGGAADLVESGAALTEPQRQLNRRVVLIAAFFTP